MIWHTNLQVIVEEGRFFQTSLHHCHISCFDMIFMDPLCCRFFVWFFDMQGKTDKSRLFTGGICGAWGSHFHPFSLQYDLQYSSNSASWWGPALSPYMIGIYPSYNLLCVVSLVILGKIVVWKTFLSENFGSLKVPSLLPITLQSTK